MFFNQEAKRAIGKVGDGVKLVEDNPKMVLRFAFVIRLQLRLRAREKGAVWIVNEME